MKVIIAGSRTITDYHIVLDAILAAGFDITTVVSGAARGVDLLGEQFAKDCNLTIERYPANWDLYKRAAGYIRNTQMAKSADALIAVWDGTSTGTRNMIEQARKYSLRIYVHYV